ncbi:MAG: hypothetical protein J5I98_25715 [Phaeodactylibacter sp.]|nr:hypothetical protein [Phaeodactylibacter sp.]
MESLINFFISIFNPTPPPNPGPNPDQDPSDGFSYIDSLETYEQCFNNRGWIFVLGDEMEVEFNPGFVNLEDGEQAFHLRYSVAGQDGQPEIFDITLPAQGQKISFSRKQLFSAPSVQGLAGKELRRHKPVEAPPVFKDFIIYVKNKDGQQEHHARKLKGFLFPTDEDLNALFEPFMQNLDAVFGKALDATFSENGSFMDREAFSRTMKTLFFTSGDQKTLSMPDWIAAFKIVCLQEMNRQIVKDYGYVFDHNAKEWFSKHLGFRAH